MKKTTILSLFTLVLSSMALAGCGEYYVDDGNNIPPFVDPDDNGDINDSNGGDKNPSPVLTFQDFKENIQNSKPTKVQSYVSYYVPEVNVVLNFNSILKIEYSPLIEAEYIYTYQKLNPIGTSDQMISSYSGVCYSKGNMFGEFNGTTIDWNVNIESQISLLNFNFVESAFNKVPTINGNVLKSDSVNTNVLFKGNGDLDMVYDASFEIGLDKSFENVAFTTINYRDANTNARVSLNTNYYYNYYDVVIPEE